MCNYFHDLKFYQKHQKYMCKNLSGVMPCNKFGDGFHEMKHEMYMWDFFRGHARVLPLCQEIASNLNWGKNNENIFVCGQNTFWEDMLQMFSGNSWPKLWFVKHNIRKGQVSLMMMIMILLRSRARVDPICKELAGVWTYN